MKRTEKDVQRSLAMAKDVKSRGIRRGLYFPVCIGKFPECDNYTEDMPLEERTECKICPFRKKQMKGLF